MFWAVFTVFLVPQFFYFTGLSFVCKYGLLSVLALIIICLRGLLVGRLSIFLWVNSWSHEFYFWWVNSRSRLFILLWVNSWTHEFYFHGLTEGPACLFYCGLTVGPTNFIFSRVNRRSRPGGGGYSSEFSVGVCRPVPQILTQFQTKTRHFPHPFSDLSSKIQTRFQTFVLP